VPSLRPSGTNQNGPLLWKRKKENREIWSH
jgi:hypothetical protein